MSSQPKSFLTAEEYLERERRAEYKSEYFRGEVFAMAGASERHNWIVTNLMRQLSVQLLERSCRVYAGDLRLRVSPTGLYTYPDVLVICGGVQFADDQKDTVLNPVVLIEVLSDSTSDYDRGGKFQQYRTLPSLQEYLTVAQNEPHVEQWSRKYEDTGLFVEYNNLSQSIPLAPINCILPMAEIYRGVEWTSEP
jgi:Uma2 family endonuclease